MELISTDGCVTGGSQVNTTFQTFEVAPAGMSVGSLVLNESLSLRGTKLSKSRCAFVEVAYFQSERDPDALRFYLTATAPETRDTESSREGF